MKTESYVPLSQREHDFWSAIGSDLSVHPFTAHYAFRNSGLELDAWREQICDLTSNEYGVLREVRRQLEDGGHLTDAAAKLYQQWIQHLKEKTLRDALRYKLKQTVQIGDCVVCNRATEHMCIGMRYPIIRLVDDGFVGFTAYVRTDAKDVEGEIIGRSIMSLWRDWVEVWNFHLDYLEVLQDGHMNLMGEEMKKLCLQWAAQARRGAST